VREIDKMPKRMILTGRVQRVGCRQYCSSYGKELGIRGAATNLSDGSVEVLLDTEDEALAAKFRQALLENPQGYLFFGVISGITMRTYNGPLRGDYVF
jgi:acylphosphatase